MPPRGSRARVPSAFVFGFVVACLAGACATYRNDLARAREHYKASEFDKSLALLRVLEDDLDSLTPSERAEYADPRGMTDYRLAELTRATEGPDDPRAAYRMHARHWLALAAAIEKSQPQALAEADRKRLDDTLAKLNRWAVGGEEPSPSPELSSSEAGSNPPPSGSSAPAAGRCKRDAECGESEICEGGSCVAPKR